MRGADLKPNVPLAQFKRTKIVATIGLATDSYDAIYTLIDSGTTGTTDTIKVRVLK